MIALHCSVMQTFFFKTKNCLNDDPFNDRIGKVLHNICSGCVFQVSQHWPVGLLFCFFFFFVFFLFCFVFFSVSVNKLIFLAVFCFSE